MNQKKEKGVRSSTGHDAITSPRDLLSSNQRKKPYKPIKATSQKLMPKFLSPKQSHDSLPSVKTQHNLMVHETGESTIANHDNKLEELNALTQAQQHQIDQMNRLIGEIWSKLDRSPDLYGNDILTMIGDVATTLKQTKEEQIKRISQKTRVTASRTASMDGNFKRHKKFKSLDTAMEKVDKIPKNFKLECEAWTDMKLSQFCDGHGLGRYKSILFPSSDGVPFKSIENDLFEKDPNRKTLLLVRGKLNDLLDLLVLPSHSPLKKVWEHQKFVYYFLLAFPTFITPVQLLEQLAKKYDSYEITPTGHDLSVKMAILSIIKEWLKTDYGRDFEDEKLNTLLCQFKVEHVHDYLHQQIDALAKKDKVNANKSVVSGSYGLHISVLEIDPVELAKQLTLEEWNLLSKVRRDEFLNSNWTRKNKEQLAPNLLELINHGNMVTAWMVTTILRHTSVKSTVEVLSYFINLIEILEHMHNYNVLMHLLSGLFKYQIQKLKKAWELLPKKDKDTLDEISLLMDNSQHYKNYHEALHNIPDHVPCIPLVSIVCKDLFTVFDTVPDYTQEFPTMLNWSKMDVVAARIHELKRFEDSPYDFPFNSSLSKYLENGIKNCWTSEEAYFQIAILRDSEEGTKSSYLAKSNLWKLSRPTERDWTVVTTGAQFCSYSQGQLILDGEAPNNDLWRIKTGKVKVLLKSPQGEIGQVLTLMPGSLMGVISTLLRNDKKKSVFTYHAEGNVEVFKLNPDYFYKHYANQSRKVASVNVAMAIHLIKMLNKAYNNFQSQTQQEDIDIDTDSLLDISESQTEVQSEMEAETLLPAARTLKRRVRVSSVTEQDAPRSSRTPVKSSNPDTNQLNDAGEGMLLKSPPTMGNSLMESDVWNTPSKNEMDGKVQKMFNLEMDQIVATVLECTWRRAQANLQGTLYLTQKNICFGHTNFAFRNYKIVLTYEKIRDVSLSIDGKKKRIVLKATDSRTYTLSSFQDIENAYQLIKDVWKSKGEVGGELKQNASLPRKVALPASIRKQQQEDKQPQNATPPRSSSSSPQALRKMSTEQTSSSQIKESRTPEKTSSNEPPIITQSPTLSTNTESIRLTPEDWPLILKASKLITFQEGDTILAKGITNRRLFKIETGSCNVLCDSIVIKTLTTKDVFFGELSLFLDIPTTASVVAGADFSCYIIEECWLAALFHQKSILAARFYFELAYVLAERLYNFLEHEKQAQEEILSESRKANISASRPKAKISKFKAFPMISHEMEFSSIPHSDSVADIIIPNSDSEDNHHGSDAVSRNNSDMGVTHEVPENPEDPPDVPNQIQLDNLGGLGSRTSSMKRHSGSSNEENSAAD